MSRTPSRMERADTPPLSRALKLAMTVTGTSGMDLTRRLGRSQSAVARYYSDREPDYAMTGEIERALGLPAGALFAMAGYTPHSAASDVLAAIAGDETLTPAQRFTLLFTVLQGFDGLAGRRAPRPDVSHAIATDPRLSETQRRMLGEMVTGYRAENAARKPPRRRSGNGRG